MRHLTWRTLLEAAESARELDHPAIEHLRGCAECSRLLEDARLILGTLEFAGTPPPSPELEEGTWGRLREEIAEGARAEGNSAGAAGIPKEIARHAAEAGSILREVWAALTGDSLRPAPALRGTAEAAARALVFETPDYAISVLISSEGRRGASGLVGQVVPKSSAVLPASGRALLEAGKTARETPVSDLGEFRFAELPPGDLRIAVDIAGLLIHCPPFAVGGESGA